MLSDIGDVTSIQRDGGLPTVVTAGAAPGESGVDLVQMRFEGGAHFQATVRRHVITFDSPGPISCRVAGKALDHDSVDGGLTVLPAGIDTAADCDRDVDVLLVAIDPVRLALASAEEGAMNARLIERLAGFDGPLWRVGRMLAAECVNAYPRGPLFWNETASRLIARVAERHVAGTKAADDALGRATLGEIRDYLMAHLDEPIDVATLAALSGRSQFHFSRTFRREVGVSPHRYVVHLRLRRAVDLLRDGRLPLAEIAAATGFADQSHLSRWVKRVHGGSMTELAGRPSKQRSTNLQDHAAAPH